MKAKEIYPSVFSRYAAAYAQRLDDIMARGEARGRTLAVEAVNARPGMRILDVACGPGTLTRLLGRRVEPGGSVAGVDLAEGMIRLARQSAPANASFELMDMEHLAFADSSFDAAVCGHGLQFATDLEAALGEARRVLRGGAIYAASVPTTGLTHDVWPLIDEVVDRWLPPPPRVVDNIATREKVRDGEALKHAAENAGFAGARVERVDEEVVWVSAEQLVSRFVGWWDFAYRMDALDAARRSEFQREALAAVRSKFPGAITTHGRTLVLVATA